MRRSCVLSVVSPPTAGPGEFDADAVEDGPLDAIIYDLDGTLVRLAVDWGTIAVDVGRVLRSQGIDPPAGLWAMLEFAEDNGHRAVVEETIGEHEREGARRSERLALADALDPDGRPPIGVCSLNCEAACRIALSVHGLVDRVDCVVGRDSIGTYKPDPAPLLAAVERLDATPERTLFVGDSERDERTAARARTRFVYAAEFQPAGPE